MKLQKRNVFKQNHKPDKPGPRRISSQDCPGSGLLGPPDRSAPAWASPGRPLGYLAACYGPVGQDIDTGSSFNIAALRASLVSSDVETPDDSYIEDNDRWTQMLGLYETAASGFMLSNPAFVPHFDPFDEEESCPDCQ